MTTIPVIVKWEGGNKTGNALLVFPTFKVNGARIVVYAHMGQHSEACITYYQRLHNPFTPKQREECEMLLAEYAKNFLQPGERLRRFARDTQLFKKERYSYVKENA